MHDELNLLVITNRYLFASRHNAIHFARSTGRYYLYSVPQTPSDRPVVRTISQLEMKSYCRATLTFRFGLRNDLITRGTYSIPAPILIMDQPENRDCYRLTIRATQY